MKGKTRTTRAATTVNKAPSKPKKTYTTTGGAQQYVRGNTSGERRDVLGKAQKSALDKPGANSALTDNLAAAGWAQESRLIKNIVGPNEAKTSSTVKMYDRMERDRMDRAKSKSKKP
jgi:hypothetical protein